MTSPLDAEPTAPGRERVALGTVLAWGLPAFGLSSTLFFVQFFFLKFATDELLMAPATVGLIFALGRTWDAVSDPIVGLWSDRTRTRIGRRRPWMLIGVPLLVVFALMIWIPPADLSGAALVAWVAVALFGFYTAFTVYGIPHLALGSELSLDHHERSRIFGVQSASFTVGMMLAFGGMQYVMVADDGRAAAARLVSVVVLGVAAILLVPPLLVRERAEHQGRGGEGLRALGDVLRNRHAQRLLFAQFVQMLGIGVVGILAPFHFEYILGRPDLIGPLPAVFVVMSVASVPLWVLLSRRVGKRQAWVGAMMAGGLVFGASLFVGEGDVARIVVILLLAGVTLGCGGVIGPSLLADVIDADELETGERKEGAYNAAWGFAIKSSNAIVILMVGIVLQLSGFVANAAQSPSAILALRLAFAMPLVMMVLGGLVLRGLRLDASEHARIRRGIDARRASATAGEH